MRDRNSLAPLDASFVLDQVRQQLQNEGRLSVPLLARLMNVSEARMVNALADLHHRGWLELFGEAPYFRVKSRGDLFREP